MDRFDRDVDKEVRRGPVMHDRAQVVGCPLVEIDSGDDRFSRGGLVAYSDDDRPATRVGKTDRRLDDVGA